MVIWVARIDEWLEPDNLILIEGWARSGLTEEQIANNMGIDRTTLWNWKKKDANIFNALKRNKDIVDFEVENALLKNAMEGNVTAQIFWLKNRKKLEWREKVEYQDTTNIAKLDELLGEIKKDASK